ncbi:MULTISPECIES: hypothetical protein [Geobacillus]|uniref:hypothetical protein n=1 Tax=Geobacillus TaxID=129337 RepID=UPI0006CD5E8A|nr:MULTISPECIES: hypothetical protein [Geobacillus]KPC97114.1 hypothetical protein LR69_04708 [Geobacillus sp. BCO2]
MKERQMTADEIIEAIQKMNNEERWKLLDKMYEMYFNKEHLIIKEKRELLEEDEY